MNNYIYKEPWPELNCDVPIAISLHLYRRARLCVNACAGASDEWLEAFANPEAEELFGPSMSIDKSLQYWITRWSEEAEKRARLETALAETVEQRDVAREELSAIRQAVGANPEESTLDEVRRVANKAAILAEANQRLGECVILGREAVPAPGRRPGMETMSGLLVILKMVRRLIDKAIASAEGA